MSTQPACEVSRLMLPDEANIAGNVHGGSILKMIEEAGYIAATRFFNRAVSDEREVRRAALARVESTSFLAPMFIGDCANVHAKLCFCSSHSAEVQVDVFAESLQPNCTKRHTNSATLWYVCVTADTASERGYKVVPAPPLTLGADEQAAGLARYQAQQQARLDGTKIRAKRSAEQTKRGSGRFDSTQFSTSAELIELIGPSEVDMQGFLRGGVLMKLMDNASGIVAFKHCKTNVVTACIMPIDFHKPVRVGSIVRVIAFATHTSARSLEIEVVTECETMHGVFVATSAFFVFVSIDKTGRPLPMKQLVPQTDQEKTCWEEAEARYAKRIADRQKK